MELDSSPSQSLVAQSRRIRTNLCGGRDEETTSSDVVDYGLASWPISGLRKDASSRSVQAEQAANTALADARKIITMRRMEDDPKLVADGNEAIAFIKKAEMKINELSATSAARASWKFDRNRRQRRSP